jgi:hypothetical protein
MPSDRKKPGLAFWATVVLVVVLVAYPLSFGPACWLTSHLESGAGFVSVFYRPIFRITYPNPFIAENNWAQAAILKYSLPFAAPDSVWKRRWP